MHGCVMGEQVIGFLSDFVISLLIPFGYSESILLKISMLMMRLRLLMTYFYELVVGDYQLFIDVL